MAFRPRIGVSACLVGELVRYSGMHARDRLLMREMAPHVDLVQMCPEVESGLGAPRESMRLVGAPGSPRLVGGHSGRDETARLRVWSRARARAIESLGLDGFVLKKGSPSCGMERVRVYRKPDTRPSNDGIGVFARELMARYPSLAVEEEGRLHDPGLREQFATRIFASAEWRAFIAEAPAPESLARFHARHGALLLAHDAARVPWMDALAAWGRFDAYGAQFVAALAQRPTRDSQARVVASLAAPLPRQARRDTMRAVEEYRGGRLPLVVPARLVQHHLRLLRDPAADASWFAPWPEALALRTAIVPEPGAPDPV